MPVDTIAICVLTGFVIILGIAAIWGRKSNDVISKIGIWVSIAGICISAIVYVCNRETDSQSPEDPKPFTTVESTTDSNTGSIETTPSTTNTESKPISPTVPSEPSEEPSTETTASTEAPPENNNPVSIRELTTYAYDGSYVFEDVASDPRGNTYNNAYIFYGEYYTLNTGGGKYDKPYVEKYLGGKYSRFTAVVNPFKTFDKYNKGINATINIYADSQKVFSSTVSKLTENVAIEIDVTGVNYLKIELLPATDMTSYFNQYSIILSDALVHKYK